MLYKYFPLSSNEHMDRLCKLFQGLIYFSSPAKFNDPFEMMPTSSAPSKDDFEEVMQHVHIDYDFLSKSAKRKLYENISNELRISKPKITTQEWINSLGVLCLTTDPRNILMWAHYGSNHSGVCIGFGNRFEPFNAAKPIHYSIDRPSIPVMDLSRNDDLLIKSILLTKSHHWSYEKESRIIKRPITEDEKSYYKSIFLMQPEKTDEIASLLASEGGHGTYEISPASIQSIYFGARMSVKNKSDIVEMLSQFKLKPNIFDIELDPKLYWLNQKRNKIFAK
jgi:hypothetical protein